MGKKETRFLAGTCDDNNETPLFKPSLPFLPRTKKLEEDFHVVGSFNDLILCSVGYHNKSIYYICNPITMQYVTLPPPPCIRYSVCHGFICEPFYPNVANRILKYDYRCRVVRIVEPYDIVDASLQLVLEIFSSETGFWTTHPVVLNSVASKIERLMCPVKLVAFQNGQMMLCTPRYIVKFDPFPADNLSAVIKGHILHLPEELRLNPLNSWQSMITSQGRLRLLKISTLVANVAPNLKVWELNDDGNNHNDWGLIHQVLFSEMKAKPSPTVVGNFDDFEWIFLREASPYCKEHEKTWLASFLKSLVVNANDPERSHDVNGVGFDLTRPNVMYMLLYPPRPASAVLAPYNMETRAIKLVPERKVPHELRSLILFAFRDVFPFVVQPWPTPLPKIGSAHSVRVPSLVVF